MKKFELTAEFVTNVFGKKLFRIKALVAFGNVEKGELGGFIEKEDNLSHDGNAWVSGSALGLRRCAGLRQCGLCRRYRLWPIFPLDHIFPLQG